MKGKLIKTDVNYILEDDKGVVIASTSLKRVEGLSLSLKNCQAIELGYDLDELAYGCDLYEKMNFVGQMNAFKLGFQKALEILGDKKYTEKDIDKAYWAGMQFVGEDKGSFGEFIQSLQQTEWDIEVVMEKVDLSFGCYKIQQKFDSDGCLILKRI
jgi:hypothetical protein